MWQDRAARVELELLQFNENFKIYIGIQSIEESVLSLDHLASFWRSGTRQHNKNLSRLQMI